MALALPQAYCDRLAAAGDPLEVKTILDEAMRGLLTEVADLPNRIDAAAWEKFLAGQDTPDDGSPAESEGEAREGPNGPAQGFRVIGRGRQIMPFPDPRAAPWTRGPGPCL